MEAFRRCCVVISRALELKLFGKCMQFCVFIDFARLLVVEGSLHCP